MTKTHSPSRIINRIGNPFALIITAPMLDTLEHGANVFCGFETYDAGYATHGGISNLRIGNLEFCALCFVLGSLYLVLSSLWCIQLYREAVASRSPGLPLRLPLDYDPLMYQPQRGCVDGRNRDKS